MNYYEQYKYYVVTLVVGLCIGLTIGYNKGYNTGYALGYETTISADTVNASVKETTKTTVAYVPKEVYVNSVGKQQVEKTDIEVTVPKTDLHIKVNGQETTFNKTNDEKYLFDKNKLQLEQNSTATVDLKLPTIDKTKRWGVGAGYGTNGIAYEVRFPAGKNVDGWGYSDKKTKAVGVMISF